MTLSRVEFGQVGTDRTLVAFLAAVFGLEELPPIETEAGTLYRLDSPGAVVKVMVPSVPPRTDEVGQPFLSVAGVPYLTMWVDDLEAVVERAVTLGGSVAHGPIPWGGTRLVVLRGPSGMTIEVVEDAS